METKTSKFEVEKRLLKHAFHIEILETSFNMRIKVDGEQVQYLPSKNGLKFLFKKKIGGKIIRGLIIPNEIISVIEKCQIRVKKRKKVEETKKKREKEEKKRKREKMEAYIFQKARVTGEKQLLEQVFALPNGKREKVLKWWGI